MNVVTRGVRNAFRNSVRTASIVVILGLSVGLALAMLIARSAVDKKIESVKASIGTTISVSPAGVRGFEGGGEPLTTDQINKMKAVTNVTKVSQSLQDRLSSDNTNLVSAIDAGSLGRRFNNSSGSTNSQFQPPAGAEGQVRSFTPPVTVTGTDDLLGSSAASDGKINYTSGTGFDASKDAAVAIIGKGLADKNSLKVGSTFTAYSTAITVVGIYDTGQTFGNNTVVMPLSTVQRLSAQANDVTSATVTADTLEHVDGVVSALKSALGDAVDVTSQQSVATTALEPLQSVKQVSLFSLIGAVLAGSVIILLTMVMIVRERRREIGVLKAIGASNVKVIGQFISEAVTFTVLGAVFGIAIGIAGARPITTMLVNNSSSSASTSVASGGPGAGGFVRRQGFNRAFGAVSGVNVRDITTTVHLSTIGYGLAAALLIAILGSTVPALFIAKIKPADVMRAE